MAEVAEELPADLKPEESGRYVFPDVRRRLIGAVAYIVLGALLIIGGLIFEPPRYNAGFVAAGIALLVLGGYVAYASWPLKISETEAVETAAAELGFALGPASVSVGWRGIRSRPVWRILAYSHEAPPKRRGLVIIDAVDGDVLSVLDEENPEDWGEIEAGDSRGRAI